MFLTLAVCGLFAGCVGEDGYTEDSSATVSESSSDLTQTQDSKGNFLCTLHKSISVLTCVGLVNVNVYNITVKNISVLSNNDIKVLVNALNIFAVNNANNNDILNVANGLKVTVSNVLNKSLNDITVCVVAGICV